MSVINNNEGNKILTNNMNWEFNNDDDFKEFVKVFYDINKDLPRKRPFYKGELSKSYRLSVNKHSREQLIPLPYNKSKYILFDNNLLTKEKYKKSYLTKKGKSNFKMKLKEQKKKQRIFNLQPIKLNPKQQKFNLIRQDYKFKVSNGDKIDNSSMIKGLMGKVDELIHNNKIGDYGIRLVFSTKEGKHFSTNYDYKGTWNIEDVEDLIGNNHYNNQLDGDDIEIQVHTNGSPIGYGLNTYKNPFWLDNKKVLFEYQENSIEDNDKYCGQRVLTLGLLDDDKLKKLRRTNTIKNPNKTLETKLLPNFLKQFSKKSGLTYNDFTEYHKSFKIRVRVWVNQISSIYDSHDFCDDKYIKIINIFHHKNHYQLITNISSFINRDNNFKYCEKCNIVYPKKQFHLCGGKNNSCWNCLRPFKECEDCSNPKKKWVSCDECNNLCAGKDCLKFHILNKHTYKIGNKKGQIKKCDSWKCNKCQSKPFPKEHKAKHICGEIKCNNCGIYTTNKNHRCNVLRSFPFDKYEDIEGGLDYDDIEYKKEKLLKNVVAFDFESKFDINNFHIVNLVRCQNIETNEKFRFDNLNEFCEYFIEQKHTIFIAHNLKGYDGFLLLNHLVRSQQGVKPDKIILAGNKIMTMSFKTVKFIDSLNFLQMRLSDFPETFSLGDNFKKGYFPYLFNTDKNSDYIGNIPNIQYYQPDKMGCCKDCQGGCITKCDYCDFNKWYIQNKDIKYDFKKELEDYCISDVDILSKGLKVFRNDMMAINKNIDPLSSITIAGYCMKLYKSFHAPSEEQLDYIDTIPEDKQELIYKTECDGEQTAFSILKQNEYDLVKSSFYGGRTEVFSLYKKMTEEDIKNGKFIRYIDIKSLYPSVQYLDFLPYGTPITKKYNINGMCGIDWLNNNKDFFGFVRCDITPPKDLLIPLLPNKKYNHKTKQTEGKLKFSCEYMENATIPTPELFKAIELGYKIGSVYETMEFKKTKHLFREYIKKFMKIKEENAGFKGSDLEKNKYCERWVKEFGIDVIPEKIKKSASYKGLAKLCLNSLWGRWGMKPKNSKNLLIVYFLVNNL